jgi:hypothetical protein
MNYFILDIKGRTNVAVPLAQIWFEGPDDLHVQFREPDGSIGANFYPVYHQGYYIVPDPLNTKKIINAKGVIVTSIRKTYLAKVATRDYQLALEKLWPSPNRSTVPGYIKAIRRA